VKPYIEILLYYGTKASRSINEKDWTELKMKSFREEVEVQDLLTGFEKLLVIWPIKGTDRTSIMRTL
jgi:hypothetical protein